MKHSDFELGKEFVCGGSTWRVTDIGKRVIIAIQIDAGDGFVDQFHDGISSPSLTREDAEKNGWFNGPPYAVEEVVFDEYDFGGCTKAVGV
jgi:hypothetical protein